MSMLKNWPVASPLSYFPRSLPSNSPILNKLLEVAQGLEYLHSENVVHGDLRGVSYALTALNTTVDCLLNVSISQTSSSTTTGMSALPIMG